ncbi:hypothetical protein Acsp02_56550 [Actinoplanes sp. NBRC 103695]|nr:hypothetical protein Acsp02_56550 [Actinoplanes sp. NBRC 103695]
MARIAAGRGRGYAGRPAARVPAMKVTAAAAAVIPHSSGVVRWQGQPTRQQGDRETAHLRRAGRLDPG